MPLNLNINAIQQQLSNGGLNGTKTSITSNGLQIISNGTAMPNGKNGIRHHTIDLSEQHSPQQHTTIMTNGKNSKEQASKIDTISASTEPPTKVIKLINGNGITLASVDKDSKLMTAGGQLQVVVSQIPLLAPTQTLRVIGQGTNGVATIELSNSNGKHFCTFNRPHQLRSLLSFRCLFFHRDKVT